MVAFEKGRTKDGAWKVRVRNEGWEFIYETDPHPSLQEAMKEAKRWQSWAQNVSYGNADTIYYILFIPETWFAPPKGAHSFSGLHMKIGRTNNVLKRLQNLKTGSSGELIIMALEPGNVAIERSRHKQFASERRQGEWFVCSPELARHAWRTWIKNNLMPPEHQERMYRFAQRLHTYREVREMIGKTPDMVNPSLHEEWRGSVFVDLINTNLIQKDGFFDPVVSQALAMSRENSNPKKKIRRRKRRNDI